MDIRVYKHGELAFTIGDPADLARRVPLEPEEGYELDPDDVAAWRAAETVKSVRREAQRRMMVLLGARDATHLDILVSNGSREAIRLLRKGAANWTPDEMARAAELERLDARIEAIRAAGDALERMVPVPEDADADTWWPAT